MTMSMPVVLEPSIVSEIARIGVERLPNEACGVVIPTPYRGKQVFEMPNRSKAPRDGFSLRSADIVLTLEDWAQENPDENTWETITIWHTHPSGGTAPSKADFDNRIEQCGNLLVALTEDGPLATWF